MKSTDQFVRLDFANLLQGILFFTPNPRNGKASAESCHMFVRVGGRLGFRDVFPKIVDFHIFVAAAKFAASSGHIHMLSTLVSFSSGVRSVNFSSVARSVNFSCVLSR